MQLDSLKTTLTQFTNNNTPKFVPASTALVRQLIASTKPEQDDAYKPKLDQEMVTLEQGLLNKQVKTQKQIEKIKEIQSKILSSNDISTNTTVQGLFREYAQSDAISFTKTNYAYLSMALILCLLLIRYRRELYSYTYSAINYDQPSYYPIPNTDKLELKEKNIAYHDSLMDEDIIDYDCLTEETAPAKIVINPVLVEADQNLFDERDELEEIVQGENLVTELIDDLAIDEGMSDLRESLDEVDKKVNINDLSDDTFSDLIASSQAALATAKKANLSFPPLKS